MVDLEVGRWNKFPHYAVVGDPTNFYVYIKRRKEDFGFYVKGEQGASGWIKGKVAFEAYNKLRALRNSDEDGFLRMCEELHSKFAGR